MQNDMTESVLSIIRDLSETIGGRLPTSQEEYDAILYINRYLESHGLHPEVQPFFTPSRFGDKLGFYMVWSLLGVTLRGKPKSKRHRLAQRLWTSFSLIGSYGVLSALRGKPYPLDNLIPQHRSQNSIVRITPQAEIRQRIVFLAHVDTDVARFSTDGVLRQFRPWVFEGISVSATVNIVQRFANFPVWFRRLMSLIPLINIGLVIGDELNAPILGANGNASGVALLLQLAAHLSQNPLIHTEVILAFTGSETVGGCGGAELAAQYGKTWRDAWWIVLDHVGNGDLCWVSEHGMSRTTQYKPHPEAVQLLQNVAAQHPSLGVVGYPMPTLDSVAPLVNQRLKAVAVRGYQRGTLYPPHWTQASDTFAQIEPDTLHRAYTLIVEILNTLEQRP